VKSESLDRITWFVNSRATLEPLFRSREEHLGGAKGGEVANVRSLRLDNHGTGLTKHFNAGSVPKEQAEGTEGLFIVVPIDFSPAAFEAVRVAASVAAHTHAHLVLCHAIYPKVIPFGPASPPWVADALRDEASKKIQPFLTFAQQKDASATCVIEEGTAATVILKVARRYGAVLIVLAPQPHGNWARVLFGPTTSEQIIEEAECHVMVVRANSGRTSVRNLS